MLVSWYLDTPIATLLAALESYLAVEGLPRKTTYFWICDFVIRQHDVKPDLEWLGECVAAVGHTALLVQPWDQPGTLARAYCIQEVYETQRTISRFDLAMSGVQAVGLALRPRDERRAGARVSEEAG